MKRFAKIVAPLMVGLFVLGACAAQPPAPAATTDPAAPAEAPAVSDADDNENRDIVIALNNNIITLDAHDARDALSNNVIAAMAESLVDFDHNMGIIPSLAESFEVSENALSYTFNLNRGISFHDGTPFNAEAVRVNVQRIIDSEGGLRQARTFEQLDSMEIVDDYTIIFHLSDPFMPFLERLQAFRLLSPEVILNDVGSLARHPVGTGQFIFEEWVDGDRMVMTRNPEHRNSHLIGVDSVTYRFVMENGTRVAMLQTGEADLIYPMPPEMIPMVQADPSIEIEVRSSTVVRYVTMNQNVEPLNDVRVRRAMNHAIDVDAYINVVRGGYAVPLNSAMSPILPFYYENEPFEFNLDLARQLLAEAGYPDGFSVTIWASTSSSDIRGMEFIAQQLGQVGIEVEVMPMEEGTLSAAVYQTTPETTELQMWYVSWSAFDPDNALRSTFVSYMHPPTGANTNYYVNLAVDEAIRNGNRAADFDTRFEYYAQAQRMIWDDAVWLFLGADETVMAMNTRLTGARLQPTGAWLDLREVGVR
ncbi:MAG: ABC transporter substrate-binding protein [Defluviitaleaceae bacterium]|nr:ABC transporter substrate-binding protein [Defluviitaleaceae bacterium]